MSRKKSNTFGLHPRNYPLSVRWRVDQDYTEKLSQEEKEWLSAFNDAYYGGDFRAAPEKDWPTEKRRESYTNKNVANVDCYPGLENEKLLSNFDAPIASHRFNNLTRLDKSNTQKVSDCIPSLVFDSSPTPEYLNSKEYKQALIDYRNQLGQTRRNCNPKITPKYTEALNKLNKVIPSHD